MPNTDDHPTATDRRLLQLSPADNVLTVIATLEPGETIRVARSEEHTSELSHG